MKTTLLKELIKGGALNKLKHLYSDTKRQTERFLNAIESFEAIYGTDRDAEIFSVPGRR